MPKSDFNKVETSLEEGLLKMRAQELAKLADFYQKPTKGAQYLKQKRERLERWSLLKELSYDLNKIYKHDRNSYNEFKIKRKIVKTWIERFDELGDEQWNELDLAREEIEAYKKNMRDKISSVEMENLPKVVEQERIKQHNKRFNVRDNWLPLQ